MFSIPSSLEKAVLLSSKEHWVHHKWAKWVSVLRVLALGCLCGILAPRGSLPGVTWSIWPSSLWSLSSGLWLTSPSLVGLAFRVSLATSFLRQCAVAANHGEGGIMRCRNLWWVCVFGDVSEQAGQPCRRKGVFKNGRFLNALSFSTSVLSSSNGEFGLSEEDFLIIRIEISKWNVTYGIMCVTVADIKGIPLGSFPLCGISPILFSPSVACL